MKFAAIDIGSNAIRLLFEYVYETKNGPVFYKDELIRVPVRLGEEAFSDGKFSDKKIQQVVKTMIAFRNLIDVHQPLAYKAYATSAMRDANNSEELISEIKRTSGIKVEIISGDAESSKILQFPLLQNGLHPNQCYLYIDVGGGSTELAFFGNQTLIANKSFNIGTIRLLNDLVSDETWNEAAQWLLKNKPVANEISAIGVGGNINKVIKMYGRPNHPSLSLTTLKKIITQLESLTMLERVRTLGLKPDRADVIVPAIKIYIHVLKYSGIHTMHVPKQGLSDGMISELYRDYKAGKLPAPII